VFIALIRSFVAMLTLPYPLIDGFNAHRAFTRFIPYNTDQFRAPFFMGKPFYSLLFHRSHKFYHFGLMPVSTISFPLGLFSHVFTGCFPCFGNISFHFSTDRRRMNAYFPGSHFLFHSRFLKGLNLIPLAQTELSLVFKHKQSKVCTTWSNDKMPLKAFYRLFLKIALICWTQLLIKF
jgi:hypothetical protein